MPSYIVHSEGPIHVREVGHGSPEHPWVPDEPGVGGGPVLPSFPGFPERPGHGLPPQLPPKDEWPELPPGLKPGVGLPIPPTVEHPWVPIPEDPEVDPPEIWPPLPEMPGLPDLSGKTLILARFYVSRTVNYLRWVVVDTEETKEKAKAAIEALKSKLPAGGVAGRPPARPTPGS